jgi:hypothetical protein
MNTCPFFREEIRQIPSNEIRSDRQVSDIFEMRLRWCSHKHSIVSKRRATASVGGANTLSCGGSLEKCPIPREKLIEI